MDALGTLTMSAKELNRLEILGRVLERRLTQAQAAEQLGLSVRQVERLCRRLRLEGRQGLISKKRGRPSNRKLSAALRERALELVRSRYADFGPTLAAEKLYEQHGLECPVSYRSRQFISFHHWLPIGSRRVFGLGFGSRDAADRSCRIAGLLGATSRSVRLA